MGIVTQPISRTSRFFLQMAFASLLFACAGPDIPGGVYDPFEAQNRRVHDFNRQVDKTLLRPASNVYGKGLPEPVRIGVGNFASNLSIPRAVLNDLLQFNVEDAVHNTLRFVVNTTVGLGGVLDPATAAGVEPRDSDFGETLHVWGVKEGAYMELPFAGPSTTRDTVGMVVDFVIDPLNTLLEPPERYVGPVATIFSKVGDRYRFSGTFDSVFYDSADSYAQARLLYLENRRFKLGVDVQQEDDLYEGLYDGLIPE